MQQKIIHMQGLEENFCLQHSILKWISSGDKNTMFFHISASISKKWNSIDSLKLHDETWIYKPEDIAYALNEHLRQIFLESPTQQVPDHLFMNLKSVTRGK